MSNRIIRIFDTTLRDGEQSPGASMNAAEKLVIAKQLARLGVNTIEAGFAASSPGDFNSIQEIGHSLQGPMVVSLCRSQDGDIDAGINALKGSHNWGIHTFIATSDLHLKVKLNMDRATAIQNAVRAIERAKQHTDNVEFSAEDATRSDPAYLVEILSAAVKAGATVLNIPDTVGYTTPLEMYRLIERLRNEVYQADQVTFSVHCHNDLGLAVANSLAAVEAGANQVECTVNGIGERAGNAALEEIVMALKTRKAHFQCDTSINTQQIIQASRTLTKITGMVVQANKAIVGRNAFAHESGIHQAGVIKDRLTYEIMTPESVGLNDNNLVLGKHSGRAALKNRITELGFEISDEELKRVFQEFKALADRKKIIYDEDIESLVTREKVLEEKKKYELLSLNASSGTGMIPTATVLMKVDGEERSLQASFGDGPVDAALNTIKEIVGLPVKLTSYIVSAITGGTDAQGKVSIGMEFGQFRVIGRGSHTDIVLASAKAFVDGLNRLEARKLRIQKIDENVSI
ncbi:MAG: 2-isopropylmalate synthase [bacterium]|jgi:2-isopropylmalate synthase